VTTDSTDAQEVQLWNAWRGQADGSARERLVLLHNEFARILAAKLFARRYSDDVEFDDYLQYARVGLLEAIDRYEPARGASFRTYAAHRIQGAVLSGLEGLTERSRQTALRQRSQQERLQSLATIAADGEEADPFSRLASVAVGLAVGFMLDDVAAYQAEDASYVDNAYADLSERQMRRRLLHLVDGLPSKEARVIRHHYLQHVPFDKIAVGMELTPGRVSQLHRRGLSLLRQALKTEGLDLSL
jgi:RNA polymerase sigma factor for flagellar operon FliA